MSGPIKPTSGSVARQIRIADLPRSRQEIEDLVASLETAVAKLSSADLNHSQLACELGEVLREIRTELDLSE